MSIFLCRFAHFQAEQLGLWITGLIVQWAEALFTAAMEKKQVWCNYNTAYLFYL